jgi:hypothetical protein
MLASGLIPLGLGTLALVALGLVTLGMIQAQPAAAQNAATASEISIFNGRGEELKQLRRSTAETLKFAPGGLVRIAGSYGDLVVEGWDRPEVEIAVTKSLFYGFSKDDQQRFEQVRVSNQRVSDSELSISTSAPFPKRWLHPLGSKGDGVAVEYEIKVPRNSRLSIQHGVGLVSISNVIGDVEASGGRGDILMWLPGPGPYAIDAKTKFGVVSSDFTGSSKLVRYRLGERFASENTPASPRIHLRMGFGGIAIKRSPPESQASLLSR